MENDAYWEGLKSILYFLVYFIYKYVILLEGNQLKRELIFGRVYCKMSMWKWVDIYY